ncbi:MAG: PQQ-binding-like beta-propeller repeat protein, partial [Verrucomicrobiota bacterium]
MIDLIIPLNMPVGVVPILIGPLQVLLAILPAILVSIGATLVAMFKPSSIKAFLQILWRNKILAVLVAAGITGICYGVSFISDKFQPQAGELERGDAEWPMFRGGLHRRGATLGESPDPTMAENVWSFTRVAKTFYASPALLGNLLFVATTEGIGPFNQEGNGGIYCLDADTKAVVWRYSPRNFRGTFSSPSISGDYLVCGEGLHITTDARITCLRLHDESQSYEFLWEYRTQSHVESSACIYDGKVYIGAGDDGFYCFALEPLPGNKPDLVWHLGGKDSPDREKYLDCETSPAAADGKVYFSLGMAGKAIICADANTGEELWRRNAPYPVFGPPAIVEDRIYMGMGNGNFIETAEVVKSKTIQKLRKAGKTDEEIEKAVDDMGPGGEVWCLDKDSGEIIWRHKLERTVLGSVAHADGRLYFGDRDGTLTSIKTDNKSVMTTEVHEPIIASPAVAKDHVYVVTAYGHMYCFDRLTLEPVWDMFLGAGQAYLSSPAVGRGHVYVGSDMNGLLCVGQPAEDKGMELWQSALGGPGKSGWTDRSPVPERARYAWRYPKSESNAEDSMPGFAGPPVVIENSLLAARTGKRTGLERISLENEDPSQTWFYATTNAPASSPALIGKTAVFVDGRQGDANRFLHLVDIEAGKALETRSVDPAASGLLLVTKDLLLVYDVENQLSCYKISTDETGIAGLEPEPLWQSEVNSAQGVPLIKDNMVFVASRNDDSVMALSLINGEELWRSGLSSKPSTGLIVNDECLAIGTDEGLFGLSL